MALWKRENPEETLKIPNQSTRAITTLAPKNEPESAVLINTLIQLDELSGRQLEWCNCLLWFNDKGSTREIYCCSYISFFILLRFLPFPRGLLADIYDVCKLSNETDFYLPKFFFLNINVIPFKIVSLGSYTPMETFSQFCQLRWKSSTGMIFSMSLALFWMFSTVPK